MKRYWNFIRIGVLGIMACGCAGDQTYNPKLISNGPTGDWTIVVNDESSHVVKTVKARSITDLGQLYSFTEFPGFTYPAFGQFADFAAQSLQGFNGTVQLSNVSSSASDHIPCQFYTGNNTPTATMNVAPSASGTAFGVSYAIPANYTAPSTTLQFQGQDALGRTKTVEIGLTMENYTASFAPVTFNPDVDCDLAITHNREGFGCAATGTLTITPQNLTNGKINITFDTNIQAGDNVPAAFDNPLPSGVQVTAPSSPVAVPSNGASFTTPVNFDWSSWRNGNYAVIAVLNYPVTVGGQGPSIRVPCEITISSNVTPGPAAAAPFLIGLIRARRRRKKSK